VLRLLTGHWPQDHEREAGTEGKDRAANVQEQQG
jgi:hypothetical protein